MTRLREALTSTTAARRGAAVLCAALIAIAAQPALAEARPLITGISSLEDYETPTFQQARATGAKLVRIKVPWSSVAPRHEPASWQPADPFDPNYDWSLVDLGIRSAREAGLTPVAMVYRAPAWAQRCEPPSFAPESVCAPYPGAMAAFGKAAARRYSGRAGGLPRVRFWQAQNEPNLSHYFSPQLRGGRAVSPALYRQVINRFSAAVKSVRRSNLVLIGGLGPIAVPRWTLGPMRFARRLLCMHGRREPKPDKGNCGGGVRFDIFAVHPYTTGGPSHRGRADDVQLGDLGKLTELLRAADDAGRIKGRFRRTPLWITEFSWDSKPPDPGGLPMRVLTRWVAEGLYRAWDAGVTRFFWLTLRDNRPTAHPPDQTIEAGLYFRGATLSEDEAKDVMYAFRFPFVAHSRGRDVQFWGRTPNSRGGRVVIQAREGGGWRMIAVVRADRHGIFEGEVAAGYGRGRRGTVRARYRGESAPPFSLRPVRDFYQPPFG